MKLNMHLGKTLNLLATNFEWPHNTVISNFRMEDQARITKIQIVKYLFYILQSSHHKII